MICFLRLCHIENNLLKAVRVIKDVITRFREKKRQESYKNQSHKLKTSQEDRTTQRQIALRSNIRLVQCLMLINSGGFLSPLYPIYSNSIKFSKRQESAATCSHLHTFLLNLKITFCIKYSSTTVGKQLILSNMKIGFLRIFKILLMETAYNINPFL